MYDYAIIGGGPGGLTLASLLPGNNILIEKNNCLGGCHRPTWNKGMFMEHGPRIYGTTYQNSKEILKTMGIDWDMHFVPYNFQFLQIGLTDIVPRFGISELFHIVTETIKMSLFIPVENISIGEWMTRHNFSSESYDLVDRLCRMTDGADASRYLLESFLQLFNQNFFYSFQQPNAPMDVLFERWEKRIKSKTTCQITKGEEVLQIEKGAIFTSRRIIVADKIIFAMPPQYIAPIIQASVPYNPFNFNFVDYAEKTAYLKYICLTFHFDRHYKLENVVGMVSNTKWGIVFIKLDDYMKDCFEGDVFSIAITKDDIIGDVYGKTALECNEDEQKEEVWVQMDKLFSFTEKKIPKPIILLNSMDDNQAWVMTKYGYGPWQGKDGFYAISTHVGKSPYGFTSFESAVCNAIWLVNQLTGKNIPIKTLWTVDFLIRMLLIIVIVLVFIIYRKLII